MASCAMYCRASERNFSPMRSVILCWRQPVLTSRRVCIALGRALQDCAYKCSACGDSLLVRSAAHVLPLAVWSASRLNRRLHTTRLHTRSGGRHGTHSSASAAAGPAPLRLHQTPAGVAVADWSAAVDAVVGVRRCAAQLQQWRHAAWRLCRCQRHGLPGRHATSA